MLENNTLLTARNSYREGQIDAFDESIDIINSVIGSLRVETLTPEVNSVVTNIHNSFTTRLQQRIDSK